MEPYKQSFFEETRSLVEDYVEDRILLLKLQASEKVAKLVSVLYIGFAIGLMLFVILIIFTFLAGYFLSFVTDNFLIGFGLVAILYIFLIFVVYYMHKRFLGRYVADKVVKLIFDKKDDIENDN